MSCRRPCLLLLPVAMDDGDTDTLVSEVAGSETEAGSDTETEESDTKGVQSIIEREEEDRTVLQVVEVEVPEARMTWDQGRPGKSGHSEHVPFVPDAGSGDEEFTKVPLWCVPFSVADREICAGATKWWSETDPRLEIVGVASKNGSVPSAQGFDSTTAIVRPVCALQSRFMGSVVDRGS